MSTKHPGYSPNNLIVVNLTERAKENYATFKSQLYQHPSIIRVTAARDLPVWEGPSTILTDWDGKSTSEEFLIHRAAVDIDFIESMGIQLVAGKSFAENSSGSGLILNEEAVKQMGLLDPIGVNVSGGGYKGQIIGIIEDYNFNNLREKIAPLILKVDRKQLRLAFIRVSDKNHEESLIAIQTAWQTVEPDFPLVHRFLSEAINRMYTLEKKVGELFLAASIFALLLSCLGLYGLTSFICEQRTKEIAIRKAYGATSVDIIRLMLFEFLKLAALANLIAWPLAYLSLNRWLHELAYHIKLSLVPFFIAATISVMVIFIAVGLKTYRSATANPVDALRYE
jgi:hypothetical protein